MSRHRRVRRIAAALPPAPPGAGPAGSTSPRSRLGLAALLCIAVVLGYLPALHGGFIWDDNVVLAENEMIRATDGL
jgi:hypothetical protein